MTTGVLVETLMNGTGSGGYGFGGMGGSYDILTESEAEQYTLESGAALIARQSREELHELFELAIIQTNEATVGARAEGYFNVFESATYGPIFEAAERTFGQKVIAFLTMLKDRVLAFFKKIFSRMSEAMHNYDKFLEKKGADLDKANSMQLYVTAWSDVAIDNAADMVGSTVADNIKNLQSTAQGVIKDAIKMGEDSADMKGSVNAFEQNMKKGVDDVLRSIGLSGSADDMTSLNDRIQYLFRAKDKKKMNITPALVRQRLTNVKKQTEALRKTQKTIDSSYRDLIKNTKKMVDDIEKSQKKGCSQLINRFTSAISKQQTIMNAYISAAIRATISRANEAQGLANALITGREGGFKAD